jgi:hypothetical protein
VTKDGHRDVRGARPGRTSVGGIIGRVVVAALITGVCWVIGLDLANSVAVAVFAIALYGLRVLAPGETDAWQAEPETAHNTGTRREVARLSWGLHGQDARVDRWSARRLHALASRRLAARGLDLDAPQDAVECQRILGTPTYDALDLDPNNLPRYADFVAALEVLERFSLEETPR